MGTDTVTCQFGLKTKAFRDNITFTVNKEDYLRFVEGYSFCLATGGYVLYSSKKDGLNGKRLHRVMLQIPDDSKLQGDHINQNKLDNTRENLRICTNQQNSCNKSLTKSNTSGYKGVWFDKRSNRWCSQIRVDGKKHHLRTHDTAKQAHRLYCFVAKRIQGEFACLK